MPHLACPARDEDVSPGSEGTEFQARSVFGGQSTSALSCSGTGCSVGVSCVPSSLVSSSLSTLEAFPSCQGEISILLLSFPVGLQIAYEGTWVPAVEGQSKAVACCTACCPENTTHCHSMNVMRGRPSLGQQAQCRTKSSRAWAIENFVGRRSGSNILGSV